MRRTSFSLALGLFVALTTRARLLEAQPPIKVDSADPPSAEQGTTLDILITGSGFASGAASHFFVTGTTNPGGVTVNGTTFLDSRHLRANITVDDAAVLGFFDVEVALLGGRTGKGIEKFSVQPKGNACSLRPLPGQFSQLTTFTGSLTSVEFGDSLAAAPVETANPFGVQAVAVTYVHSTRIDVFLLDPGTPGNVGSTGPDATLNVPSSTNGYNVIQHDVDGNGVSDVLAYDRDVGVFIFSGQVVGGVLSYSYDGNLTDSAPRFGSSVAAGNLDSDPAVEIAVGAAGDTAGKNAAPGQVVLFDFGSTSPTARILSPANEKGDRFGATLSIGDVTGDGAADLVVGARNVDVAGIRDAGATYVFPHGSLTTPSVTFPGAFRDEGLRVATLLETGDADPALEIFATTGVGTSGARGVVFQSGTSGPQTLPIDGLDKNYDPASAGDFDLDGATDILIVGAQNATESSTCPSIGAAHAYFDFSFPVDWVLQPPDSAAGDNFYGWAVEALNGTNLVLISERRRDLDGNGTKDGQVYVYSVQP